MMILVSIWESDVAMLNQLESLIVFSHSNTMAEAASRLRVSQSALSKRLSALEHQLGYPLLQVHGRKAELTEQAIALLEQLEPLYAQMSDVLHSIQTPSRLSLDIAMADAIMVSWGASLIARLQNEFPDINIQVHSHRSATIIERLNRGRYQLGICTGTPQDTAALLVEPLLYEPMAIVTSRHHRDSFKRWQQDDQQTLPITCIEENSAMWRWLQPSFKSWRLLPERTLESSVGAARLAMENCGHALVPEGVARVIAPARRRFRLTPELIVNAPNALLTRPCSLICRKGILKDKAYRLVYQAIQRHSAELVNA
ncbi:LysR family transcriptional regulator [Reinekea blandensis]|uniref:Transcriptional regulator, LysR family protein n=1 Tax=Reinekea blandensis MED297 TaxID=314283 RepID=A4BKQ2_9GAMM|nr:LysR family transcriptional regulator [Reinekea blandensis]EAR07304.1 transcriptional regulator, LysR family protein [Reinekea sp. MED297] [Reinekea blandensis MED297]